MQNYARAKRYYVREHYQAFSCLGANAVVTTMKYRLHIGFLCLPWNPWIAYDGSITTTVLENAVQQRAQRM